MMDTILTQDHGMCFTTAKLSENMEMTPEGFLLCRNVPVARTGSLFYDASEVPVAPGVTGDVEVVREDEDLFNPATMASLNGKDVTLRHPDMFISAANWRDVSRGTVLDPRRGTGADSDLLFVDILVKDSECIRKVRHDGLRQISLGYRAGYLQLAPGKGRQRNIIVNHVALVEQGRCGPRCAVQDEMAENGKMEKQEIMDAEKRGMEAGLLAAVKALFSGKATRDEGAAPEKKDSDEVAALKKRIAELEAQVKDKKTKDDEEEEEKKKKETADANRSSTMDAAAVSELLSTAGIIAPGYKPTADALASPEAMKRDILAKAYTADAQKSGAAGFIELFAGKEPKFDSMDAATLDAAFIGAGGMMKAANNGAFAAGLMGANKTTATQDAAKTFAEKSKELWG